MSAREIYIVVAPAYRSNSNGIKSLHKLCNTINQPGGDARMHFLASNDSDCQDIVFGGEEWTNPAWNTPPLLESERSLFDTAYVIYPEIIVGNPLQAKKVIRYFGNREAYCNGYLIGIGDHDFLAAHSISTRKNAHCYIYNSSINPTFHDRGTMPARQRTLDLTYVGKGYLYGKVGDVTNTVMISRDWPMTQEQLAILLRQTRIFYTWDSWTSTNVEAVLCGAVPYYMRYEPWTEEDIDGSELGFIPRMDERRRDFDPVKFMEARQALQRRIETLASTWDDQVRFFMEKVAAHFSARGF